MPSRSLIPWIAGAASLAFVLLVVLIVLVGREDSESAASAGSDPATTNAAGQTVAPPELSDNGEPQTGSLPTHDQLNGRFAYGDHVSGEIGIPDDYDLWLFDGIDGEVVTFEMTTGDANRNVYLRIYDSGGWRRAGTDCGGDSVRILNYELIRDDTFEVHAGSCEGSTGPYQLSITKQLLSGVLQYDSSVGGELVVADDYNRWAFEGTDDQIVTVEMSTGDTSRRVYVEIYDDNGWRRAASDCTSDFARILNHKLNGDGTFYVHAGSCDGSIGPYQLALAKK